MLLKKQSKDERNVKLLQKWLNIKVDGDFGNKTHAAVENYQRDNNMIVDGVVGNTTWTKLFELKMEHLVSLKDELPESVYNELEYTCEKFNIITIFRLSHFLSQCAHESGNFKFLKENLNYSESALNRVFGKYFNEESAKKYARNPEMIASKVYASRMGNGDEESKEGWKFRGRGYIQLTGKNNYTKLSEYLNEDLVSNPDLVSDKYPLASGAFFFDSNNLWSICDDGPYDDIVKKVTRRVNGGYHGLDDRQNKFDKYWKILC
jgi:putative chitinase